ncbi:MAG: hypothetical protein C5B55_10090 [Blastocatellia bacterium]|nr:MAG: hypothetical protein C5B55_10090 [Blastocatellia bacterium]
MSKEFNRTFVMIFSAILVFAGLLTVAPTTSSQSTGVATGPARNAAIVATTEAVLKETSQLRELSIIRPVKSGAQSRAEIERMVVKNLDEDTTPGEMHATEVLLKKFGLAPMDFNYRPFVIKLLTEQVAGYYDPKVQRFYLADWIELEGQKPVMAHELTHALQDQHFNLRRFEKWPRGDSDAELATHSLVEGDATLAMTLYMAKNPMVALAFIRSLGGDGLSSEQFKQAPRAIRESLMFPYEEGLTWATQIYRRGGWKMVSEAFTKLPQSTEQILHPDKYLSYEAPVKVDLPELRTLLGNDWKRIDYDVNGEWGLYLILDEYLNDSSESKRASAGWAGDRFELLEGTKPQQVCVAQMTVWDTENDAREFYDAYLKRTSLRYPDAQAHELTNLTAGNLGQRWQTSEGAVVLELRGKRVAILEGVPAEANLKGLRDLMWR